MATLAIMTQGTTIQFSSTTQTELTPTVAPTFLTLACLSREITYQPGTPTENDVTVLCSTDKEFQLGLSDPGTLSATGFLNPSDANFVAYNVAAADKLPRLILVTYSDTSEWRGLGIANPAGWGAAVDGSVSMTLSFRMTGAVLYVAA